MTVSVGRVRFKIGRSCLCTRLKRVRATQRECPNRSSAKPTGRSARHVGVGPTLQAASEGGGRLSAAAGWFDRDQGRSVGASWDRACTPWGQAAGHCPLGH